MKTITAMTGHALQAATTTPRPRNTALRAGAVAAGVLGALGASLAGLVYEGRSAAATIRAAKADGTDGSADESHGTMIDASDDAPPGGDGVYLPDGTGPLAAYPGPTRVLTMMGDSLSVGYGCSAASELPGVRVARRAAVTLGRPIRLTTRGVSGAITADLVDQLDGTLADRPDVVVIIVGANDVRHQVALGRSVTRLAHVVTRLRAHGIGVVMASCPDLGVIRPMQQPLRHLAGRWSRMLARAQEKVTTRAGGVPVSLSTLVSPAFYADTGLFYLDRFHPSGRGYELAAAALQPAVDELLRD